MKLPVKLLTAVLLTSALAATAAADTSDTERPASEVAKAIAEPSPVSNTDRVTSTAGQSIRDYNLRTLDYTKEKLADRAKPAPAVTPPPAPVLNQNIVQKSVVQIHFRTPYSCSSGYRYGRLGYYRYDSPYRYDYACRYLSDCPCRYLADD